MPAVYVMQKNLTTQEHDCVEKMYEFLRDAIDPVVFDKDIVSIATALGVVTITLDSGIPESEQFDPDYYEVTRLL